MEYITYMQLRFIVVEKGNKRVYFAVVPERLFWRLVSPVVVVNLPSIEGRAD
jgi:hypothetical protein